MAVDHFEDVLWRTTLSHRTRTYPLHSLLAATRALPNERRPRPPPSVCATSALLLHRRPPYLCTAAEHCVGRTSSHTHTNTHTHTHTQTRTPTHIHTRPDARSHTASRPTAASTAPLLLHGRWTLCCTAAGGNSSNSNVPKDVNSSQNARKVTFSGLLK